jgi:hypothetical protein
LKKKFLSKIAIYLSLGLHKGPPNCRRSLQPSKENIQQWASTSKDEIFITFFLFFWAILPSWIQIWIANPDTDPGTPLNPDPIRIWIRIRIQIPSTAKIAVPDKQS